MNHRLLPKEKLEQAKVNPGECINCGGSTKQLANVSREAPPRPEAYCEKCHLSIPLW